MLTRSNHRRVPGGLSYADAMLRFNASTEGYMNHVLSLINRNLLSNGTLVCVMKHNRISVQYNGISLFSSGLFWVERSRELQSNAIEKDIIIRLEELGVLLNKDSYYYQKWVLRLK